MARADRREFTAKTKLAAFDRAGGCCERCGTKIITGAEYDHATPAAINGGNDLANCVCMCRRCHALKTHKTDVPQIAKTKRILAKRANAKPKGRPFPGSRASGWKKTFSGEVVRRG